MRVGVHLLGSRGGYRTLAASPDLAAEERAVLEALVFGQTNDAAYLASLEREPAVFLRHLPSGRFALTRLFAGPRDDAGRATLELRTLVMNGDDYARLVRADLERVLSTAALWALPRFADARTLEVASPPPSAPVAVTARELLILDGWLRARQQSNATAVLEDSVVARRAVLAFIRAIAADDVSRCRWGIRLLSLACEVDVATAVQHVDRGRRTVIPLDLREAPTLEPVRFLAGGAAIASALPTSARLLQALQLNDEERSAPGGGRGPAGHGLESGARSSGSPGGAIGAHSNPARVALIVALSTALALALIVIAVIVMRRSGSTAAPGPERESAAPRAPAPVPELPPSVPAAPARAPSASTPTVSTPTTPAAPGPVPTPGPASGPSVPLPPTPAPKPAPQPAPAPPTPTEPKAPTAPALPTTPIAPPEPVRDESMEALDRITAEDAAALTTFETLLEKSEQLLSALDGPAPNKKWNDRSTEWSREHCLAVSTALVEFDAALSSQSLVWLAPTVQPFAETGARASPNKFADRAAFLAAAPAITGVLASLELFASDAGGNALATRLNASTAINRGNCADRPHIEINERTQEFARAMRPFLGLTSKGRPDSATVSGVRTRLQAALRAGLDTYANELAPALVDELRRRANRK